MELQVVEFEVLEVAEAEIDVVVLDAAFPLLAGTHQLYVELLVPLGRQHEIVIYQKGKGLVELRGVGLGRYLLGL